MQRAKDKEQGRHAKAIISSKTEALQINWRNTLYVCHQFNGALTKSLALLFYRTIYVLFTGNRDIILIQVHPDPFLAQTVLQFNFLRCFAQILSKKYNNHNLTENRNISLANRLFCQLSDVCRRTSWRIWLNLSVSWSIESKKNRIRRKCIDVLANLIVSFIYLFKYFWRTFISFCWLFICFLKFGSLTSQTIPY